MSKYFTSVYKNYYEKIETDKNIETNCKNLNDKILLLDTSLKNCISYIESCSWDEKGKNEVISSYIPIISNNIGLLKNGVLSNLSKVIFLTKNDLYNLLVELKEQDDDYCKIQESLNSASDESDKQYISAKLEALDKMLVGLVNNIDNKILEIKSYNNQDALMNSKLSAVSSSIDLQKTADELLSLYKKTHSDNDEDGILDKLKAQVEENKIKKLFKVVPGGTNYTNVVYDGSNALDEGNCVDLSLLDANWKVVDTAISVAEYATVAYNKGIRQNSNTSRYSDLCLAFSYVHASNMYNGDTSDNAESAYNWKHAAEFSDYFNDNKQETLKVVYDQIAEGKPVVMQVNGNTSGTSRHFVTVVGIKDGVSSENVQESDLLILDSWDGQLERMDTSTSRFMTTGTQCNKSYSGYYLRLLK